MSFSDTNPQAPPPSLQSSPPPSHLIWAVVSTLLFWPLGVFSLVFATRVNSKWASGDVEGARTASGRVIGFAIAAIFVGAVVLAVLVIGLILYAGSTASGGGS
jgi:hypothetical protein